MLLHFLPARELLSTLFGVLVDSGGGRLGGTSRSPGERAGDCVRGRLGDTYRRGSICRGYGSGEPPELEPVSCGRIAHRSGRGGVPQLGQPVTAGERPAGRMGVERVAVRFTRS